MATRETGVRAVLFDLWGTLVASPAELRGACFRAMASDLGVDPRCYADAFRESHGERFIGATGSLSDTVLTMAERCGGAPGRQAVTRAAKRRLDLTRSLLKPSDETLLVLDELRARGFLLALVTDSSTETPTLWKETMLAARLDHTAFSCLLGVCKPDPSLFLHACKGLEVAPRHCAYVGDGGGHELTAAAALGMRVVRLRVPGDEASDRYDDDHSFAGAEIAALPQLLEMSWLQRAE
jgi:putative hydrolase of the HAD superfamily